MHCTLYNRWVVERSINGIALISLLSLAFSTSVGAQILPASARMVFNESCVSCHNPDKKKGKLDLESILQAPISEHRETWNDVAWMLREREMPPEESPAAKRPKEAEYDTITKWLEEAMLASPSPLAAAPASMEVHTVVQEYCLSCLLSVPDSR